MFPRGPNTATFAEWLTRSEFPAATVSEDITDAADTHSFQTMRALARVARRHGGGCVNVHFGDNFMSLKDVLALRLSRPRGRLVVTVNHPTPWESTSSRKRLMTLLAGLIVTHVVTISEATADILRAAPIARRKLTVIPIGIPTLAAGKPDRAVLRAQHGLENDDVAVVALGRLVPHKGFADLIEAFAALDAPRSTLFIVGDGPQRAELEAAAARHPGVDIRFLGYVEDISSALAMADVFALPSHLEGFGVVYIEAARFHVPSIACSVGGPKEVVRDGETGLLVTPGDLAEIKDALSVLIGDRSARIRMGDAAFARLERDYTDVEMARRYDPILWPTAR